MKDSKTQYVGIRLTEDQMNALKQLIESGKAKNTSSAIQYLILQHMIKN